MTPPTFTPGGLLFALEAVGVHVELNAAGDGLHVTGTGRPPADLLAELKARKPEVLAHLAAGVRGPVEDPAKEEMPPPAALPLSPDVVQILPAHSGEQVSPPPLEDLPDVSPNSGDNLPPLPDWAEIAAQPGHCGSCARSKPAAPEWGADMVTCTCDPVAWWPASPPLAIHYAARCGAYQHEGEEVGRGWRAKPGGKRWGALPLSPSHWEDLPTLDGGHVEGGAA